MGQGSLFPQHTSREIMDGVKLNPTVEKHDEPRLSAQHVRILARLKEGPATNVDLASIGQRFGARLQELRLAGYRIEKRTLYPGVIEYKLEQ